MNFILKIDSRWYETDNDIWNGNFKLYDFNYAIYKTILSFVFGLLMHNKYKNYAAAFAH